MKSQNWKEVKLEGNLITDDSIGTLEGLIGLEVLEGYDKNMVQKTKRKRKTKPELPEPKKLKGNQLTAVNDAEDTLPEKPAKSQKKKKGKTKDNSTEAGKFVLAPVDDDKEIDYEQALPDWQSYNLPDSILKALHENGFIRPTEIQRLTLPPAILGRRDILGAAETGSGKTLAFGLPILSGILHLREQWLTNPNYSIRKAVPVKKEKVEDEIEEEDESAIEESEDEDDHDEEGPSIEGSDEDHNENDDLDQSIEGSDLEEEDDDIEEEILPGDNKDLFAVILAPTRELAIQVRDHIKAVAKYTDIKVVALVGGMAIVKQKRVLKGCPEIIVATPGRLWELLKEGEPHLNKINDIHFLVIDETDRMVEKGHFEELKLLMERINRDESKKSKRQNFIFSATLTLVHDIPDYLRVKNANRRKKFESVSAEEKLKQFICGLGISQPKVVDITRSKGTAEKLAECRIVCEVTEKDYYLYYFLQQHPGRTIVFCNSIDCVRRLGKLFDLLGCKPLPLHANMIQKQRLKNLERFRDSQEALLVATDVAARGLDIPNVDHVIHYQVPRTSENYVHRSGRTARANTEGITVLIMDPSENRYYNKLCKTLNREEGMPIFPISFRHLSAVKDRVNLAREVDILELRTRKVANEIGWLEKAAEEMDMILDDLHAGDDEDEEGGNTNSTKKDIAQNLKMVKAKRNELVKLLQKPIFPRGFSYKYPTASGKLMIPLMGLSTSNNAVKTLRDAVEVDTLLQGELLRGKKKKKRPVKNGKVDNKKVPKKAGNKNPKKS